MPVVVFLFAYVYLLFGLCRRLLNKKYFLLYVTSVGKFVTFVGDFVTVMGDFVTAMGENVTDMGCPELSQDAPVREVKKHAATIHCSNGLSLLQRKVSNALLYHAYEHLMTREEHEISIRELCRLIAYHGNNHAVMRDALRGLLSTVIEWNVVSDEPGVEDWTASSILASVSLKGPVCVYAYSPRMKRLLHSPAMFGKINLFIQSRFRSGYGLALYENCIRYRSLGFTKWFPLDVFRKLMGVPQGKYTLFRDLKRRVLDKSVEEVNTWSDLFVEAEVRRESRRVVQLRFRLKERPRKVRLGYVAHEQDTAQGSLAERLVQGFGLSVQQAAQVTGEYGEVRVREKIALIEASRNYRQGRVQNPAAYLMSALRHDYQPHLETVLPVMPPVVEGKQRTDLQRAWETCREKQIEAAFAGLDADIQAGWILRFRNQAAEAIQTVLRLQRRKYTAETVLSSPQIRALLRQFLLEEVPGLAAGIATFEEFSATLSEEEAAVGTTEETGA